jgi:glycerol-3-phosphate cytidylyltransferase
MNLPSRTACHAAVVPERRAARPLPSAATDRLGGTVALTYGTYDLFHIGHVRLFERIKQRFDRLIVAVSTDEFNAIKGKQSVVP